MGAPSRTENGNHKAMAGKEPKNAHWVGAEEGGIGL